MRRTRDPAKEAWRILYRLQRIGWRETEKALLDAMLTGTGWIRIAPNGEAEHIPVKTLHTSP